MGAASTENMRHITITLLTARAAPLLVNVFMLNKNTGNAEFCCSVHLESLLHATSDCGSQTQRPGAVLDGHCDPTLDQALSVPPNRGPLTDCQ